jgi:hypothetical protein
LRRTTRTATKDALRIGQLCVQAERAIQRTNLYLTLGDDVDRPEPLATR